MSKEERRKRRHDYHQKNKEIMKYAKEHGISIPEARKQLESEQNEISVVV